MSACSHWRAVCSSGAPAGSGTGASTAMLWAGLVPQVICGADFRRVELDLPIEDRTGVGRRGPATVQWRRRAALPSGQTFELAT